MKQPLRAFGWKLVAICRHKSTLPLPPCTLQTLVKKRTKKPQTNPKKIKKRGKADVIMSPSMTQTILNNQLRNGWMMQHPVHLEHQVLFSKYSTVYTNLTTQRLLSQLDRQPCLPKLGLQPKALHNMQSRSTYLAHTSFYTQLHLQAHSSFSRHR